MAFAETANLTVRLSLQDGLTRPLQATTASLGKLNTGMSKVQSAAGYAKQAVLGTTQALSGMASHLKGVITGPLGLIGLGAGLFSVAGAFQQGITKASDMAATLEKLQGLTGGSAEKLSTLIAVFDKFGINSAKTIQIVGFASKTLGNLANTFDKTGKSKLQAFDKQFGIVLTNSQGKALQFGQVLLKVADYYNSTVPAANKAAVAAKIFGRGYTQLIPLLKLGSKGITEAQQAAAALGLELTAQNAKDLKDYQKSIRGVGEAIGGLELQFGLAFIPLVKDLADSLTNFLASGGKDKLIAFFKDLAKGARDVGTAITGTVIPTIQGLGSAAMGFWNTIPGPLRDILLKGFVADRTIHFLLGVSPIHLATSLLGDIAGPVVKTLIANRLIPQPVVIVGGGVPGLPGGTGLPAAAGAGALLTSTVVIAAVAASTWAFLQTYNGPKASAPGSFTPTLGSAFDNRPVQSSAFTGLGAAIVRSMGLDKAAVASTSKRQLEPFNVSIREIKAAANALRAAAHAQQVRAIHAAPVILSTAARHDAETTARIGQINLKVTSAKPSVTTNVTVNVTAGGIHKTVHVQSRWGTPVGSRYGGVGGSNPGGL